MHISLQAETLGTLFGIPVTNSLILSLLTGLLLVGSGVFVAFSLKVIPNRAQGTVEVVLDGILGFMTQTLGSMEQAKKFFPLIATIFLFILFNNWIGVLPGTGSIGFYETDHGEKVFVPLFRSANSDLNTTLALALVAMVAIHSFAVKKLGLWGHAKRFLVFNRGPIHFFVGLLEAVGEFARVLSFSFRLFGNVFAGEVLLVIVMGLVPLFAPFPFLLLEFFVGFIQALVFAMLTMIFLKIATSEIEH
ncbi:MAG: ATP synthase F0 subunit A [Candidatus Wildermuthbacteria bacterium RIFCSPHIGHO2_02_FULL_49_9]|uniref:ATP synthase subunit a n=2 Tax=Candidatus Wildermuthiibacteriota TaxID=1817923 RepID=A0A1G2R0P8_9BACT|nr:MAG: ATP synthase F0 subunit A [Candidatus Wildermuthbacteria bacterium RIFCSPHIGHO2_01_FULL_49_22b]OHA71053.1 MAG: ATP synthase F0 subunit A [Candidatus Wildermuthbacteria bacterium RIFCSPHIGHO2_02_FULL_49_9]